MKNTLIIFILFAIVGCKTKQTQNQEQDIKTQSKEYFEFTKKKALEIVKTGFNAGDGYSQVFLRDYNTFIELSTEVYDAKELEENLLVFFRLQGDDGNIQDLFLPKSKAVNPGDGNPYNYSKLEPTYCGQKSTVETDQETSLVQSVYKYVSKTGNKSFLKTKVGDETVAERLEKSMEFLLNHRWSEKHGMIYGATTADWGDVQHDHPWGVFVDENTHYCVDIYDNAMMLIALDNMMELMPSTKTKWKTIRKDLAKSTMKTLWDEENQKFIPHVYLENSPFPEDFDENEIYYHGGTAVAIEAGLLSKTQIKVSLEKMIANVKASGASSIGLTMYPPYPEWAFENKQLQPYSYQNGGDWAWFGGRMIQQLIKYGFVEEAYREMYPMVKRVKDNDGFFEWYTVDNKPKGSGTFRGSAGVLYEAILMFETLDN